MEQNLDKKETKTKSANAASGAKNKKKAVSKDIFDKPLKISENAIRVLEKRYFKKDKSGNVVETIEGLFKRVSYNLAEGDLNYDKKADLDQIAAEFYDMISSLDFMPNSPTLMNAGRELQQLAACFVLPVEDSMEQIFETVKHTALIHKSGGGTGFDFSRLRPSGSTVGSTSGVSSGPISFMTVFDAATEAIKQGGTRRGANMGILRVDHPDILNFIACKKDNDKINNFNISVTITEAFMEAVEADEDYKLRDPRTGDDAGSLNAREVFEQMTELAWKNGDPGIVFIDRINRDNPTPQLGAMEATNPCGEQPLLPYESCNLGSINLGRMLKETSKGLDINWDKMEGVIHKSIHFLDNVIEMNSYPVEEIRKITSTNRKVGLGVMGFADMLIKLGIPYNSQAGVDKAEEIMSFIQAKAKDASTALAEIRGNFANIEGSMYDGQTMRNATVTTIAPTGTISIIANCSSGVEPLFALVFTRTVMEGTELLEVNPLFEEVARERGFDSPEIMKKVAETGGLHGIDEIPQDVKDVFITAHDVTPEWHLKMQAAFQNHCDNAVSKTVNFGSDATVQDVAEVYQLAYKLGCKGVTVYRDGSRDMQVLTVGTKDKKEATAELGNVVEMPASQMPAQVPVNELPVSQISAHPAPKPRGDVAFGVTKKVLTGCGNLYVTINEDPEGNPFEIFTQIGKAGGCVASQTEAIGRLASLALRAGIDADEIISQTRGISCHLPVGFGENKVTSCSDAMSKALQWYTGFKASTGKAMGTVGMADFMDAPGAGAMMPEVGAAGASTVLSGFKDTHQRGACPDCGGTVEHSDGCVICRGCGYTEC